MVLLPSGEVVREIEGARLCAPLSHLLHHGRVGGGQDRLRDTADLRVQFLGKVSVPQEDEVFVLGRTHFEGICLYSRRN